MPNQPSDSYAREIVAPVRIPAAAKPVGSLFLLMSFAAVDGTLALFAATGRLSTLAGAITVGLTTIAGAGAWITARESLGGVHGMRRHAVLATLGIVTAASALLAAAVGALAQGAFELQWLPKAGGLALMIIGAEVTGLRVPRVARMPLPILVTLAGALGEVLWHYLP